MTITVSNLVRYLKNKLDTDSNIQNITVSGELSNFHAHQSGHFYFTLKDEKAAISCVMFRSSAATVRFKPKNGDKVLLNARTSLFEVSGQLQLYVNSMVLDGLGDLYQRYEILKKKLNEEGYFDASHKKEKPFIYPEKIAVLVGENSAAMSDIKRSFARRWPYAMVDYYPCLVQGTDAPGDIISNLLKVDEMDYECIVLARGGGSFEDLFCFNDEALVKTIYRIKTFIVTGIGHEQDFSLADFAADLRAATPTAAIELITPDHKDVYEEIQDLQNELNNSLSVMVNENRTLLENLTGSRTFRHPMSLIENPMLTLDVYQNKLAGFKNVLTSLRSDILLIIGQLGNSFKLKTNSIRNKIDGLQEHLLFESRNRLKIEELHLKRYNTLLEAYSAENVLKRGFALIKQNGSTVRSKKELNIKEDFTVLFTDGTIQAHGKE